MDGLGIGWVHRLEERQGRAWVLELYSLGDWALIFLSLVNLIYKMELMKVSTLPHKTVSSK